VINSFQPSASTKNITIMYAPSKNKELILTGLDGIKRMVIFSANNTLLDVRHFIDEQWDENLQGAGNFLFYVNDVQISLKQEVLKMAYELVDKDVRIQSLILSGLPETTAIENPEVPLTLYPEVSIESKPSPLNSELPTAKVQIRPKSPKFLGDTLSRACYESEVLTSNSETNKDQSADCSEMKFPFQKNNENTPPEHCWPRLVLMPSFPTSGSELVQTLFRKHTGVTTGAFYKSEGALVYHWGTRVNKFHTSPFKMCDKNLTLPHSGQVALLKSHAQWSQHEEPNILPTHIVRLTRNPGDNLLRNAARWKLRSKINKDYLSFIEDVRPFCNDTLTGQYTGGRYTWFHSDWNEAIGKIPHLILRFEDLSNPEKSEEKMREMLDFVGQEMKFQLNYAEVLRVPDYTHGTLMRDACGVDMARKVHDQTKNVSTALGYKFNFEEGIWEV